MGVGAWGLDVDGGAGIIAGLSSQPPTLAAAQPESVCGDVIPTWLRLPVPGLFSTEPHDGVACPAYA